MAVIIGSRNRIRQKPRRNYKSVVVVTDDPEGTVDSVEVTIQPHNGIVASPSTINLEKRRTRNGKTRYVFGRLDFENGDPNGLPFNISTTMKDHEGGVIGQTENFSVTAQDNDGINVTVVNLRQNDDGETYTMKVVVKGTNKGLVNEVAVFLTPQDGGSDADPEDFTCGLVNETATRKVYKNENVTFADPDSVIDMQYLAEITLSDESGKELDYLEFDIVGEE